MSALFQVFFGAHASAAAASYDRLEENCEGTGTPAGWTNSGSPNWDYTTVVLQGSQSLLTGGGSSTYYTFTGSTSVDGYALFRMPSLPGSVTSVLGFRDGSGNALGLVRINASGQVTMFANGSDSPACVDTMSANTTYHVWFKFVSSGNCTVAFSTTGTKPTSGNAYTFQTGGSGTAARYIVGTNAIVDRMLASTTTIGDSP